MIDGEAVVADARGVASFDLLRGRAREKQAVVWAFDVPELDGEDLRDLPPERRKERLKILLKRAPFGVARNDDVAGDGPALFAQAMGWRVSSRSGALALPVGALAALAQGKESDSPTARREALEDWVRKRR